MNERRYLKQHGKLTRKRTLVLDERLDNLIQEAVDNGFLFQEWVRDLLLGQTDYLTKYSRIAKPQKAS